MPQMGESIAEGTIVRWIKKVGDAIDKDEPLFEISTDKVDAEIPSPGAGVLTEIKVKEGETVPVNSVVAVIGVAGEKPARPAEGSQASASQAGAAVSQANGASELPEAAVGQPEIPSTSATGAPPHAVASVATVDKSSGGSIEDLRRLKSSPLVRRIAREHNVDIRQINGTGVSGRVTKNDILGYIETGKPGAPAGPGLGRGTTLGTRPAAHVPAFKPGEKVEIVPMTIM